MDLAYEYVEAVPEELACSICMKVLCEPHLVNCCEQQFCKNCLEKWLGRSNSCPHCRSTDFSHILMKQASRKIKELKVYCPNKQHGCTATFKVSECEEHLSTTNDRGCLYILVKCPNHCSTELPREQMKTHLEKECPKRSIFCFHCNLQGEQRYIMGEHLISCPLVPVSCPKGCKLTVLQKNVESHRDSCPLEPIPCPFSSLGCKSVICRRDMQQHVEGNMLQHMTELTSSHCALQAQHAALQEEHAALRAEKHSSQNVDLALLKADFAELKDKHASLIAGHTALLSDYSTLKDDFLALKDSFYGKLRTIAPILQSMPYTVPTAQLYTAISDTTPLFLGGSASLVLNEAIRYSGHHYMVLWQQQPLPNLHFRLQWEMDQPKQQVIVPRPFPRTYKFRLYFLSSLGAVAPGLTFDIDIKFTTLKLHRIGSFCCGKPSIERDDTGGCNAGDGNKPHGQLMGLLSLHCQQESKEQIGLTFSSAHKNVGCKCVCHAGVRGAVGGTAAYVGARVMSAIHPQRL